MGLISKFTGIVFLALFILSNVNAIQIVSEPILSCSKNADYFSDSSVMARRIDFFMGNKLTAVLDPAGPNFANIMSIFSWGNRFITIYDSSPDQQVLFETVCGEDFGSNYAKLGGVMGFTLPEIESYLSLPQNSLYIEAYRTNRNGTQFFNVEQKSAFVAYRIFGANSYVNDTTPGPVINYFVSQIYSTPNGNYRNINAFIDPLNMSRFITSLTIYGPLPSMTIPQVLNGSSPTGPGQVMSIAAMVPVPQTGYDVYHVQAVDNVGVGVTEWVVVTP